MGRQDKWRWSKVGRVHQPWAGDPSACTGEIHSYRFRCHDPGTAAFERCIGLAWCATCRQYSGDMVRVPHDQVLPDALTDLPAPQRERLLSSEVKLVEHLARRATARRAGPAGRMNAGTSAPAGRCSGRDQPGGAPVIGDQVGFT
jgi:hypothetical protein